MADDVRDLLLPILRDIQARLGRLDERMANLELRMTARQQHLGALLVGLPAGQDRLDAPSRRVERIERRLELGEAN